MVTPDEAPGVLMTLLSITLVVAVGVWAVALVWIIARFVSTRLERRYLPGVGRWSRRRAGVRQDAGPWACPSCSSVNPITAVACYHCGGPRGADARELSEATTDPAVFHRPPPRSRFDASLYRGPGAPSGDACEPSRDPGEPTARVPGDDSPLAPCRDPVGAAAGAPVDSATVAPADATSRSNS